MEVKVQAKFIKMGPRKVRLIANMVRGKKATEAIAMLKINSRLATSPVIDAITNAISIAKIREMDEDKVIVGQIFCDDGPRLKRGVRAGRHHWRPINKQMSHLTVILQEAIVKEKPAKKVISKPKKENHGTKS